MATSDRNAGRRFRRQAVQLLAAISSVSLAGGAVLSRVPPEHAGHYPLCPVHQFTGWLCPGCGGTRALAALARGRVADAWHWNGLVLLALALGMVYFGASVHRNRWVQVPAWAGFAGLVVCAAFTVARNLAGAI